jgi:hypothetical protein
LLCVLLFLGAQSDAECIVHQTVHCASGSSEIERTSTSGRREAGGQREGRAGAGAGRPGRAQLQRHDRPGRRGLRGLSAVRVPGTGLPIYDTDLSLNYIPAAATGTTGYRLPATGYGLRATGGYRPSAIVGMCSSRGAPKKNKIESDVYLAE